MVPAGIAHFLVMSRKLHEAGRLAEAETWCRRTLAAQPNNADALNLLGIITHQMTSSNLVAAREQRGKLDEAISIRPDYSEAHANLGVAWEKQGKLDDARSAFEKAIEAAPARAFTYRFYLGTVLTKQGKLGEAIHQYQQVLAIKPDYAEAHCGLGNVLQTQGKLDEAAAHYRQALALKPDYVDAHNNLGAALRSQGRSDEAAAAIHQALALQPNYALAFYNLGNLLRDVGKFEEARVASEKAVELCPASLAFHYGLAISKRFLPGDGQLEVLEAMVADERSRSMEDRIYLHFALAKGYDDLEDHERSFAHLFEGNSLKRQQIAYDEAAMHGFFARLQEVFSPELMRDKQGLGDPSSVPVFIVGMPRSGTTLIEQILAGHPKVFGAGELMNLTRAVTKLLWEAPFPDAISSMGEQELRELGAHYVTEVRQLAPAADRIIDKMPANFRLAGLIHLALPNARIIHVRRDPLDTCLSCFSQLFSGDQPFSFDLAELGRYYRAYEMLMDHWRRVLPPGVMLEAQYEHLTSDLEGEARRMIRHCGLEWDAACLSFHDTERPVRTASAAQVRQPIYRSSIGRWRVHEHLLGPLIEALGVDVAGSSRRAEDVRATSAAALPLLIPDSDATAGGAAAMVAAGIADLLAAGRKLHQAGRLAEAEIQYRRVLAAHPGHADALNLLESAVTAERTVGEGLHAAGGSLAQREFRQHERDAPANPIFLDAIKAVTFHNGVFRIDCIAVGPNNEERPSGTLVIPGNRAGPILGSLTQAVQELDKKLREQAQQATAAKAN